MLCSSGLNEKAGRVPAGRIIRNMFVDQVKVTLVAGKGGDGCLSFRRESRVPKGGPDGGNGGEGGSIFLQSKEGLNSLVYFRYHPVIKAGRGAHGQGSNKTGEKGKDRYLNVPVGTQVRKEGRLLYDFLEPGQTFPAARGGSGGRGNAAFVSSTNRAPRRVEKGTPGEENVLTLELKLIADAGLVGFPNVGKSTLISKISAAKPVIADYPFTTLTPHLGVVDAGEFDSFILADIPGLIQGAHAGHGLGVQFLKHIQRTRLLIHVVDISEYSGRDPFEDIRTVEKELQAFDPALLKRPQILVANKMDLLNKDSGRLKKMSRFAQARSLPFFAVSAVKGTGLKELVYAISRRLKQEEQES